MIKIEIEGKDYQVKNAIDEITVEEYSKILNIFVSDSSISQKLFDVIEIISDIPVEVLDTIGMEEFTKFDISFIEGINDIVKSKDIPKKIEIDGIKYGYDYEENRSARMIVDLEHYRINSSGKFESLVNIIAIIMRPIIEEDGDYYKIEPYNHRKCQSRVPIFMKMKAVDVYPIINFFLTGLTK